MTGYEKTESFGLRFFLPIGACAAAKDVLI